MTCAACAARIEKRLNRLDGVAASVNFATERATVSLTHPVPTESLLAAVEAAGYHARIPAPVQEGPSADPVRAWRRRLTLAAVLTLPVVMLAMVPAWQFPGWQWVSLILAVPVVAWAGWPFHRSAAVNLRHGTATMDTLVSLGTLAAFGWSLYALLFGGAGELAMVHQPELLGTSMSGRGSIYLEAATGVTTFLLAGRYLEARSKRAAGAALRALLDMGAKQASVLRDGVEVPVPIDRLRVGDEFVVRPGEKIPTDGVVVAGESAVDMSLLTGEAMPVEVGVGGPVIGAAINEGGRLIVRATRVGADTQLAQLGRLVEQAQSGKAPVQRLADRISAVFVPVVVVLSLLTLAGWVLAGAGWTAAFTAAVAVLIIACPCALGLATPTALLVGSGRGAQLGLVIAGPEVLEQTRRIDTVILDKTGTVTTGSFEVRSVKAVRDWSSEHVLRLAGSVQQGSEHPIGRAILQAAGTALPTVSDFRGHRGFGVSGQVEGRCVLVGHVRFLRQQGCHVPADLNATREAAEAKGETAVLVAVDQEAVGLVTLADAVKDTSAEAIADLRGLGLHPVLLTGDNEAVARRVAEVVGIDEVYAEVLPADKVSVVRERQERGHVVAMVGDGVNDAAALAQADLGIAMGAGSDVAIQAADLTVIGNDLRGVGDAIRLSRRTLATIKGNLVWAFGYNVAAIPIAAAGLLSPMLAGAAMALSSVFVVFNSLRLRGFRSSRPAAGTTPRRTVAETKAGLI